MSDHNWIRTFSGGRFYPLAPRIEDIHIEDGAHALSNLCRFTGHVRKFYSVCEHSVRVARYVLDVTRELPREYHRVLVLEGLLHDFSESYLNDVATPVKTQDAFAGYRAAEKVLDGVVRERFGLPREESDLVRQADKVLLATEARDLLTPGPSWKPGALPLTEKIQPWAPSVAKFLFLRVFEEFSPTIGTCGTCGSKVGKDGIAIVRADFLFEPEECACGSVWKAAR